MKINRLLALKVLLSIILSGYGQATDSITVAGHVYNITDGMPHTLILMSATFQIKESEKYVS